MMYKSNGKITNIEFQEKEQKANIMSVFRQGFQLEKKSSDGYMKLQKGDNKIRILSQFIDGWEEWDENRKPVRHREKPEYPSSDIKQFIAAIVWNYAESKIQILQLTQSTIIKALQNLSQDEDWGQLWFYDIKISRSGDDKLTKYQVNPLPAKPLPPQVEKAFRDKPCNLDKLFTGEDPFAQWPSYTPGVFSANDVGNDTKPVGNKPQTEDAFKKKITKEQAKELSDLIGDDDDYREHFYEKVRKSFGSPNLADIPASQFEKLKDIIEQHNIARLDEEMRSAG